MRISSVIAITSLSLGTLALTTRARAEAGTAEPSGAAVSTDLMTLLPIQLTAFGDFRYRFTEPAEDQFEIGSVELDAAVQLSPHVMVSAAFAYDPDANKAALGAFTVDGSLFGTEPKHLLKSGLLSDSGIVFGKFDVPFGIAYLEYPATENRFVELPSVVNATHGGWNDLGMQAYAIADRFDFTFYFVNGDALEAEDSDDTGLWAHHAYGGRAGVKPLEGLSLGASIAQVGGSLDTGMWGADLSATAGPLVIKNEFIRRTPEAGPTVQGAYTQALSKLGVFFAGVRYEATVTDAALSDTSGGGTLGAEIFPHAEVRIAHLRSFQNNAETTFIQLVGGSIWQPTGLRR